MYSLLKLLVNLGYHGKRHVIAEAKLIEFMHNNGLGV